MSESIEFVTIKENGIIFEVLAQPGARTTRIEGLLDNRLKIRLSAKAVDGAANIKLRQFLSTCLKVSKSSVTLLTGEKGRQKTLFVEGDGKILRNRLFELAELAKSDKVAKVTKVARVTKIAEIENAQASE